MSSQVRTHLWKSYQAIYRFPEFYAVERGVARILRATVASQEIPPVSTGFHTFFPSIIDFHQFFLLNFHRFDFFSSFFFLGRPCTFFFCVTSCKTFRVGFLSGSTRADRRVFIFAFYWGILLGLLKWKMMGRRGRNGLPTARCFTGDAGR